MHLDARRLGWHCWVLLLVRVEEPWGPSLPAQNNARRRGQHAAQQIEHGAVGWAWSYVLRSGHLRYCTI